MLLLIGTNIVFAFFCFFFYILCVKLLICSDSFLTGEYQTNRPRVYLRDDGRSGNYTNLDNYLCMKLPSSLSSSSSYGSSGVKFLLSKSY